MNDVTAPVNLGGIMGLIKKSKYPLAHIFEAITNSLEAISQRHKLFGQAADGIIEIGLYFTGILKETSELEAIKIIDNGIGFNDENYNRFIKLLDNSKGYNNRGSGRIQYLHRANKIEVLSYYQDGEKLFKRHFLCDSQNYIQVKENIEVEEISNFGTELTLSMFQMTKEEKEFFENLKISDFKKQIKNKFLLRFYLDKEKENFEVPTIKINFFKNGKQIQSEEIKPDDIPLPLSSGQIEIPYVQIKDAQSNDIEWVKIKDRSEKLNWAHFKIPQEELDQNGVFLCSKDVPVEDLQLKQIKKNESVDGHRYMTAIYGELLDREDSVSHSVDSFKFPSQSEIEQSKDDLFFNPEKEYLFSENIRKEIDKLIPTIYGDIFNLQKEQEENISAIARAHGIPIDIARSANINLTDNEQQITDKIYKKQAENFSKDNQKIKKIFEKLNNLNPTSEDYQELLEENSRELLKLIPQQNKEELSRYVIRREMVTDILRRILNKNLLAQAPDKLKDKKKKRKDSEGLIHDLIFRRKSKNTHELNDLWILSEEYVHFEGTSELPINQISTKQHGKLLKPISKEIMEKFGVKANRRPDIFLYPEEGKCILIELKAPEIPLSEYLDQVVRYSNLIANFSEKKIDRFFCYLIGENLVPLDIPGDYSPTINGDRIKTSLPIRSIEEGFEEKEIATAQIEIIKLSSLHKRAHARNRSFADKLGIRLEEIS